MRVIERINDKYKDQKDKLTPSHLKRVIETLDPKKIFSDVFEDIPNLEDLEKKTKNKRKRIKKLKTK